MAANAYVHERDHESDRSGDFIDLPSGGVVDLFILDSIRPALRTQEDAHLVMQLMQDRILNMEYQLEAYGLGYWSDGRRITPADKPHPLWAARAKKALGHARLIKSTTQQCLQTIAGAESRAVKHERAHHTAQLFIECARGILDPDMFARLMAMAQSIEGQEFGQNKGAAT